MTVSKTALGVQVMKDRSVSLSSQQRSALILCDGKRSAEEVVRMTAAVGVTLKDIDALVQLGLVETFASSTQDPNAASFIAAVKPTLDAASSNQQASSNTSINIAADTGVDFSVALNAAITLCASSGFKGFSLNMALTGVDTIEKLQKLSPEIRRVVGDTKYKPLHAVIFGQPL